MSGYFIKEETNEIVEVIELILKETLKKLTSWEVFLLEKVIGI